MIKVAQYKGKSLTSKLIKLTSHGKYSHTAIILPHGDIVEAWEGTDNVRIIKNLSEGHTPGTEVDIYTIDIPSELERDFIEFVLSQVGKPYNKWGLIAFYLNRLRFNREGEWFCSQLLVGACHSIGQYLWGSETKSWQISPTGIVRTSHLKYHSSTVTH